MACLLNRTHDVVDRLIVRLEVRCEAALVADARRMAVRLQEALQRMEDFRRPLDARAEIGSADRHDHEFLHVDAVRRMGAAVQDVHHRHGQKAALAAAQEAIERRLLARSGCLRRRHGNGEDGVRAELRLVFRAVRFEHRAVDESLGERRVDVLDRLQDALAEVASLVAVTQLKRFKLARRCARRRCRTTEAAVLQDDIDFHRRVAARVNDFACMDAFDLAVPHRIHSL